MSTFRMIKKKCGLCGHEFETRTLMSTNAFGSPDLDLRPPQMKRATMSMWIDKCPNCGYAHAEIEKNGKQHKAFIKSKNYKLCEGKKLESGLARDYYRYALVLLRENDKQHAYDAFLHAAWALDDANDKEGASICRNKAIALFNVDLCDNPNLQLRHIDLLRRVGKFSKAINLIDSLDFEDDLMNKVANFQKKLSEIKDTDCYRVADCDAVFMKLYDEPFALVKSGKKKIEVRCNDEKRKLLKVGDTVVFYKQSNPSEKVFTKVKDLRIFNTFKDLYSSFPLEAFGYEDKTVDEMVSLANKIYTYEEQKQNGALAIILEEDFVRSIFGQKVRYYECSTKSKWRHFLAGDVCRECKKCTKKPGIVLWNAIKSYKL